VAHTSRELLRTYDVITVRTFFVAGIGAATALTGEQCWPLAEPDPERTASGFACRALGAATDLAGSLFLRPPLVLGLCRHTALETDGILHLLQAITLHPHQFVCYFTA
jgi:hypothetical protein